MLLNISIYLKNTDTRAPMYIYNELCAYIHTSSILYICYHAYGVASVSRIDYITGLFCRILSLLQGSFAKETCNCVDPTNWSHPISMYLWHIDACAPVCTCTPQVLCLYIYRKYGLIWKWYLYVESHVYISRVWAPMYMIYILRRVQSYVYIHTMSSYLKVHGVFWGITLDDAQPEQAPASLFFRILGTPSFAWDAFSLEHAICSCVCVCVSAMYRSMLPTISTLSRQRKPNRINDICQSRGCSTWRARPRAEKAETELSCSSENKKWRWCERCLLISERKS